MRLNGIPIASSRFENIPYEKAWRPKVFNEAYQNVMYFMKGLYTNAMYMPQKKVMVGNTKECIILSNAWDIQKTQFPLPWVSPRIALISSFFSFPSSINFRYFVRNFLSPSLIYLTPYLEWIVFTWDNY